MSVIVCACDCVFRLADAIPFQGGMFPFDHALFCLRFGPPHQEDHVDKMCVVLVGCVVEGYDGLRVCASVCVCLSLCVCVVCVCVCVCVCSHGVSGPS